MLRYRTETFSGIGPRDAAEVMAFETFELGNTDIPEYLCSQRLGQLPGAGVGIDHKGVR